MAKSRSYASTIILLLVLAGVAGGGWYFYKQKSVKQPEYSSTKVARGDITQVVTATGDLQPVTTVDVSSQISGQVIEVLADFNTRVKTGQVLARIDPATYIQKLKQAKADLSATQASNTLQRLNTERIRGLREKNLVSQQELDSAEAQLKQSEAQLQTRQAAVDDAEVNLERCTIYAPIDGIVLSRATDKGRMVAASTNAPTLFTIVADLTRMQINAGVAEADIGSIVEGQDVMFTVDAFPSRQFRGRVLQVRNAPRNNQNVVSYETIIEVANEDMRLKPGMTANVSIVIAQKTNVLRVANSALRVRIPQELQSKVVQPAAPEKAGEKAGEKSAPAAAAATMTDEQRRAAMREIMTEAGIQRGTPPSPEQIEKAKKLADEKGLDPEMITRMASGGQRGGGAGGGGSRRGGSATASTVSTVTTRTLYKFTEADKKIEAASARLGISDGFFTEVVEGLAEGDVLLTAVIMPGAAPQGPQPQGGANNPFQQRGGGGRRM